MTLKPTDMLQIQSAIDAYEKKFPRRPAPTAEQALAWRLGRRAAAQFLSRDEDYLSDSPAINPYPGREQRALQRVRLGGVVLRVPRFDPSLSDDMPAVRSVLRFGWWGMIALGSASVFALGAFVGGFK